MEPATGCLPPNSRANCNRRQPPSSRVNYSRRRLPNNRVNCSRRQPPSSRMNRSRRRPPNSRVNCSRRRPPNSRVNCSRRQPPSSRVNRSRRLPPSSRVNCSRRQPPSSRVNCSRRLPPSLRVSYGRRAGPRWPRHLFVGAGGEGGCERGDGDTRHLPMSELAGNRRLCKYPYRCTHRRCRPQMKHRNTATHGPGLPSSTTALKVLSLTKSGLQKTHRNYATPDLTPCGRRERSERRPPLTPIHVAFDHQFPHKCSHFQKTERIIDAFSTARIG